MNQKEFSRIFAGTVVMVTILPLIIVTFRYFSVHYF